MDMSNLMREFESKKEHSYKQLLGQEFESLSQEARENPEIAAYLDLRLTKEEAIGYFISAAHASGLDDTQITKIWTEMEIHFMNMSPEKARRIYAKRWL
ncbi:hypothetical protein [Paenibacillus odorifer]|uniref:hypothetical protein n=1 Tax=Paenibacillus odorifer TaxID=189426 RepID=UPI00096E2409|nr:hypothetical protein [Paenibacillus odorifer]OMD08202.1 hypothetical protein BJP47_30070 [Paenibacillus odorifer]